MPRVWTVRTRMALFGYDFDKLWREMIGLRASQLFLRDKKLLPERMRGGRINTYYDDETEYLDQAIGEALRDSREDKQRDELRALIEQFGARPYPRIVHTQGA
jgi:hypothetical protein